MIPTLEGNSRKSSESMSGPVWGLSGIFPEFLPEPYSENGFQYVLGNAA